MYESPILVMMNDLHRDLVKKQNDYIFETVEHTMKCEVNREELIKALAYDRDQYDKGFRDGRAYKPPIETKADRIRAMTDEELAEWLCDIAGWLPEYEGRMHPILEWLKEEATE